MKEQEKRIGRQTPTTSYILPYTQTKGEEAVELYERSGRDAMEWQKGLLYDMMAQEDDGAWTHMDFGYAVPRQNGKNEVISMRELWGLMNGEAIVHTAHRTKTSTAAWQRLVHILEESGYSEEAGSFKSGKSKGQENIVMSAENGGGKIEFRTRSSTGGLGESYDLLVIDEAQEYKTDEESALQYTVSASANPQTIYLGTPPTPYSSGTIFPKLRKSVLCGEKEYSGWAEWGIDEMSDGNNRDLWYETNPSLGIRIRERTVASEIGKDAVDFNIQRLGLWIKYNQKSEFSRSEWECLKCEKLPKFTGQMNVGIKYSKDGSTVSMSIALKTDTGKIFVETISCKSVRDGDQWIIAFLGSLGPNLNKIVIDGKSGQENLAEELADLRIRGTLLPKVSEVINANAFFYNSVFDGTICHMGQPALTQIVSNCEKRAIGSGGGYGFQSLKAEADITIMDSVILAAWAAHEFKDKQKQKVRYD